MSDGSIQELLASRDEWMKVLSHAKANFRVHGREAAQPLRRSQQEVPNFPRVPIRPGSGQYN